MAMVHLQPLPLIIYFYLMHMCMLLVFFWSDLDWLWEKHCSFDVLQNLIDQSNTTGQQAITEIKGKYLHHRNTDEEHGLPLVPIQRHNGEQCL